MDISLPSPGLEPPSPRPYVVPGPAVCSCGAVLSARERIAGLCGVCECRARIDTNRGRIDQVLDRHIPSHLAPGYAAQFRTQAFMEHC